MHTHETHAYKNELRKSHFNSFFLDFTLLLRVNLGFIFRYVITRMEHNFILCVSVSAVSLKNEKSIAIEGENFR